MTSSPDRSSSLAVEPSALGNFGCYWSLVCQNKLLILLGVTAGLIAGILTYARTTPIYQSTAQVLVVKKRPDSVLPGAVADQRSQTFVEDYLATHLVLIQSDEVLRRAAELVKAEDLTLAPADGDVLALLKAGLVATRDMTTQTTVLNLSFRSASTEDSPRLLKAVVDAYRNFLTVAYGDLNQETLDLINKAKNLLQHELAEKETAYQDLRLRNPLAIKEKENVGKDNVTPRQDRIHSVEAKRSALLLRQMEIETHQQMIAKALAQGQSKKAILATLKESAAGGNKAIADGSTLVLETTIVELKLKQEELAESLGPQHPQIKSLQRRITLLREQLARHGADGKDASDVDPLDVQVQAMTIEHEENRLLSTALERIYQTDVGEAEKLAKYLIQEEEARGQVARLRQLCDGVIDRIRQIDINRELGGGYDARLIIPPSAGKKVSPILYTHLAMFALIGLAAGFGFAYMADFADKSFRSPLEIRQRLRLPVVGHIPALAAATPEDLAELEKVGAYVVTYHSPRSPVSEAFRGVRTALYFSTHGQSNRVIQITSPAMGDGKSTLAANVAVSMAQSGKRTVLIDADFRRPRLHKLFPNINKGIGLSSVITAKARLDEVIQQTVVPNLSVIPCGPRPANPAELLTSSQFLDVLAAIRPQFEFILVDTPPVLMVSDPCIIAPHVDGVLLVLRLAKNNRPTAERAVEILESLGAKILGVMVNDRSSRNASGYGYRHGYGYGYGYRYDYRYSYQYGYGYQQAYAESEEDAPRGDETIAVPKSIGENGHAVSGGPRSSPDR
jgi:succinoglycan biosynthesis transport protein ExoP